MNTRIKAIALLATAAATAATVSACGSSDSSSSSGGGKTLVVGVDQPFTGSSKDAADSIWNAMQLYLKQHPKAGDYTIKLQKFDDATASAGKWDAAQCAKNANEAATTKELVAVMGTYNSGCAEVEVPVLNQAEDGPLLMVSEANTYPGLTKEWDTGEPAKFYPTGVRSYARVVATDDYQGTAGAQMAVQDLKVTNCLVLDDAEVYGKGVANQFAKTAEGLGIKVSQEAWDGKAANYNALFNKAKSNGVDCIYFGGIEDNNGAQLIKDKVKIMGDNTKVKVITPDGFVGYPDFDALPESEGVYQTFPGLGLDDLAKTETTGKFLTDYASEYGGPPASPYALYGVQALQVIMAGVEASDGTRKGVNAAVVGDGADISIPAADAILGKDIKIDPATGDVNQIDITIQQITGGKETSVKPWPVS